MEDQIIDYNEEPVHYCSNCLYLGNPLIVGTKDNQMIEFCPKCGGTHFSDSHIEEWENKFESKYKQGRYLKLKKSWEKIMEM